MLGAAGIVAVPRVVKLDDGENLTLRQARPQKLRPEIQHRAVVVDFASSGE